MHLRAGLTKKDVLLYNCTTVFIRLMIWLYLGVVIRLRFFSYRMEQYTTVHYVRLSCYR